jgi:hypothetical protein
VKRKVSVSIFEEYRRQLDLTSGRCRSTLIPSHASPRSHLYHAELWIDGQSFIAMLIAQSSGAGAAAMVSTATKTVVATVVTAAVVAAEVSLTVATTTAVGRD